MSDNMALPPARLCIGITGHREGNAAFAANRASIERTLADIFDTADRVAGRQKEAVAKIRLLSPLAQGADMLAAELALVRMWEICAPMPFGLELNIAINLNAKGPEDIRAFRQDIEKCDAATRTHANQMREIALQTSRFELAEQDEMIGRLFDAGLVQPNDVEIHQAFNTAISERAAAASRVTIEQSDILVAIWDGTTMGAVGGTRHTIAASVNLGVPVFWINAAMPGQWMVFEHPEELAAMHPDRPLLDIPATEAYFEAILNPSGSDKNERAVAFHTEQWHPKSRRRFHSYRRIEKLFGGGVSDHPTGSLVQHYEAPDAIAGGSAASFLTAARALAGGDNGFVDQIEQQIFRRFAWADGLSTYLSDAYRGGMVLNFLLSAAAIIGGIAYLPLVSVDLKWPFALFEFILLIAILAVTSLGGRKNWHRRWFQTRRVAEYFRHAPILLLLGVARSTGRWPRGKDTEWPEFYARETLCDLGLPSVRVSQAYLRGALDNLLSVYTRQQREYHEAKAIRLTKVHHNLDKLSEWLFILAVTSVAAYLGLFAAEQAGLVTASLVHSMSKIFTFFGVAFPALGGAFAGIRYFGDFERFAAISEVAAEKLCELEDRIDILRQSPNSNLNYTQITDLAHALDDIVVTEIENWQSVFGSKQLTVPV